jgi:hypothetical protein
VQGVSLETGDVVSAHQRLALITGSRSISRDEVSDTLHTVGALEEESGHVVPSWFPPNCRNPGMTRCTGAIRIIKPDGIVQAEKSGGVDPIAVVEMMVVELSIATIRRWVSDQRSPALFILEDPVSASSSLCDRPESISVLSFFFKASSKASSPLIAAVASSWASLLRRLPAPYVSCEGNDSDSVATCRINPSSSAEPRLADASGRKREESVKCVHRREAPATKGLELSRAEM